MDQASGSLTDLDTIASVVQAVVTAGGIVVGGIFAYYKFFKDRVYRPRVAIDVRAGRLPALGHDVLLCRVTVKNLGGTKLTFNREGTVVVVDAARPAGKDFGLVRYSQKAVLGILVDHLWLEVAEAVSDDVVVRVPPDDGGLFRVSARLVVAAKPKNIEIWARTIVPAGQRWEQAGTEGPAPVVAGGEETP